MIADARITPGSSKSRWPSQSETGVAPLLLSARTMRRYLWLTYTDWLERLKHAQVLGR